MLHLLQGRHRADWTGSGCIPETAAPPAAAAAIDTASATVHTAAPQLSRQQPSAQPAPGPLDGAVQSGGGDMSGATLHALAAGGGGATAAQEAEDAAPGGVEVLDPGRGKRRVILPGMRVKVNENTCLVLFSKM